MESPAFTRVPEEIWELLLGMLEDSKDISSALIAIPHLEPVARRNGFLWLFGQVVPHLLPYLKRQDIFACRQVCTRWSRGMDQLLSSDFHLGHRVLTRRLAPTIAERLALLRDRFTGIRRFDHHSVFREFLEDMKDHPPERNPFVGRNLHFHLKEDVFQDVDLLHHFSTGALDLLRRFGRHIWYLIVSIPVREGPASVSQILLSYLRLLPNLKVLHISGPIVARELRLRPYINGRITTTSSKDGALPAPVESLKIYFFRCTPSLIHDLVSFHSSHLHGLTLDSSPKMGFPKLQFPNLNELTLGDSASKNTLLDILQNLDAPSLSELKLDLKAPTKYMMDKDLFPHLKNFRSLKMLTLNCSGRFTSISEDGTLSPAMDSISSLKSFTISSHNRQLNYNFLLCFPALLYLKIDTGAGNWGSRISPRQAQSTLRLAEFIRNGRVGESNVWELLPQLGIVMLRSGSKCYTSFLRSFAK